MIIKDTSVKKIFFDDPLLHIEYCARVCTDTQNRLGNSGSNFVQSLISMGHLSCLEHAAVDVSDNMPELDLLQDNDPKFGLVMSRAVLGSLRFSDLVSCSSKHQDITKWKDLPRSPGLVTFEVESSRITSQQFERHRNLSYSERSLRYVDLSSVDKLQVVLPKDIKERRDVADTICNCWERYKELRSQGISKDHARYVLPMSIATKFCVSGDLTWWLDFLKLRYHKQASEEIITVARKIYELLPDEIHDYVINNKDLEDQFKEADEKINRT